jgi:hypothetical protein
MKSTYSAPESNSKRTFATSVSSSTPLPSKSSLDRDLAFVPDQALGDVVECAGVPHLPIWPETARR